jgi:microcompartment protein CcmK/EutM
MYIARVVGLVVSTMKYETLTSSKLLIVQETDVSGKVIGTPRVAVDSVNAGEGDVVLVAEGSAARQTEMTRDRPVDQVIMGVIDTLMADGEITFRKEA